jgi:parallel beta-helix repeat protein
MTNEQDPLGRLPDLSKPTLEGLGVSGCPEVEGYEILRVLGEGGMGVVYLARQKPPLQRQVALKIVKPGMDSKQVIARFEAERQALALLDHPNIAQVYDAGTTRDAHPFFAMEYVNGPSIVDFCDQHKLNLNERLDLFIHVCEGVHHAHQKGILHRDIKPSNILMCTEGDKPVPKIIDFGVAKALTAHLTDRTLVTEQDQLLGTPEYMSPEQAEMRKQEIDTRSDVYSLGAVLYELLTGVPPFDPKSLREGGIDHIRRTIRDEDPKTPSTRLSTLGAPEVQKIAQQRGSDAAALTRYLRKELEWIPLKAMRKDRAERYPSALALAEDIHRYLEGARLAAGPASVMYRLRKFAGRHRVAILAASAVVAAVIMGIALSEAMRPEAQRARKASAKPQTGQGPMDGRPVLGSAVASQDGLVAHWKLDETEGPTAHDSAGQYHGTVCGDPQWTTGKVGGALQFDGLDDYVELPIDMVISSLADCTLATWVNFSPGTGRDRRIFDFGRNSKVYMCLTASTEANGPVGFAITVLGNMNWREDQTMTAYVLRAGWHHLAVTMDARNKTHSLYLDGHIIARNPAAQFSPRDLGATTNNWLGRAQYPGEHYFKGSLDDFRIYNRALSEAEVTQLAGTTPADPKLLDWRTLRDAASALQGALYGTASGTDDAIPVGAAILLSDTGWDQPVGTWDPATRTAILTQDLNKTIQIDSNGITLDGNGHAVTGSGAGDGDARYWGVRAYRKNNLTIKNLRVSRFYRGICLNACRDCTLTDNVCSNSYVGVTVWGRSANNTVATNTCSNNRDGIWLYYSNGNNVANNRVLDNQYSGIWVYYSYDNRVVSNDVSNNKYDGIWLYCSEENRLTENLSADNGHSGIRLDGSSQDTLAANTTSSNTSEGILLMSSSSNTLADNRALLNHRYGIMLGDSNDNSLVGNTASDNKRGIGLALSNHNKLTGNTASDNQDCGIGILNECRNNVLANNTASGNATGLYLAYCSANTVADNIVNSNKTNGIWIRSVSLDNDVTGNTVMNNAVGVYIYGGARNNAIYNNNFIDNQAQTSISPTTTDNLFSLGRPVGGNYWSDWTGPDADGDGFVDKPYAFKYGQDNMPWAVQDGWTSQAAPTTHTDSQEPARGMDDAAPVAAAVLLSDAGWSRPVGTWDPATKTAVLTQDVNETIQVDSNGITLDGNGHHVTGPARGTSGDGVVLVGRTGVTIKNLNVAGFGNGILLSNSTGNTLTANTCNQNSRSGISLRDSSNGNILINNAASNNTNDSDSVSADGINVDHSSNNKLIGNVTESNKSSGIWIGWTSFDDKSSGNELRGNTASGNAHGIGLGDCIGSTLTGNQCSANTNDGIYLLARCTGNNLTGNTCNSNIQYGIRLAGGSSGNAVTGNTVANNGCGIRLVNCSTNHVYRNDFIGNSTQASVGGGRGNVFDMGRPTGGNYWNDWTGPDTDGDGFVDNAYAFPSGQDDLPWATRDGWTNTPPPGPHR